MVKKFNEDWRGVDIPDTLYTIELWRYLEEEIPDSIFIKNIILDSEFEFSIKYIKIKIDIVNSQKIVFVYFFENDDRFIEKMILLTPYNKVMSGGRQEFIDDKNIKHKISIRYDIIDRVFIDFFNKNEIWISVGVKPPG